MSPTRSRPLLRGVKPSPLSRPLHGNGASSSGGPRPNQGPPAGLFGQDNQFLFSNSAPVFTSTTHYSQNVIKLLYENSSSGAAYNSKDRYDPPKCHPNTRTGLLKMARKWIKKRDPRIMWLYGSAGSGKSAIAQTIAEELSAQYNLAASFFFSRTAPASSNRGHEGRFISTIAYQLTQSIPGLRSYIEQVISNLPSVFDLTLDEQVMTLILEPLQQLRNDHPNQDITASPAARIIIVDGLDECNGDAGQTQVLEALKLLVQHDDIFPFSVFVASRPELTIRTWFTALHAKSPDLVQLVSLLDHCDSDLDIQIYVSDEMTIILHSHVFKDELPPGWPSPFLITQIVRRACGQFIYATTVIKYIKDPRHYPDRKLAFILDNVIPENDSPYAELDALYLHVLKSAQCDRDVHRLLAFRIVTVSFTANLKPRYTNDRVDRPFFRFIEHLLSLPRPTEALLADLQSVMSGDLNSMMFSDYSNGPKESPDVQTAHGVPSPSAFYHASFLDFLLDKQRSGEYHIDIQQFDNFIFGLTLERSRQMRRAVEHHQHVDNFQSALCFNIMIQTQTFNRPTEKANVLEELRRWDQIDSNLLNQVHTYTPLDHTCPNLWEVFCPATFRRRTRCRQELAEAGYPPELFVLYSTRGYFPKRFWRLDCTDSLEDLDEVMAHYILNMRQSGSNLPLTADKSLPWLNWDTNYSSHYYSWTTAVTIAQRILKTNPALPHKYLWHFEELYSEFSDAAVFFINCVTSLFDSNDAHKPPKILRYFEENERGSGSWRASAAAYMLTEFQNILFFEYPISHEVVSALEQLSDRIFPSGIATSLEAVPSDLDDFDDPLAVASQLHQVTSERSFSLPLWQWCEKGSTPRFKQIGSVHDYIRLSSEYIATYEPNPNMRISNAYTMKAHTLANHMKGSEEGSEENFDWWSLWAILNDITRDEDESATEGTEEGDTDEDGSELGSIAGDMEEDASDPGNIQGECMDDEE